MIVEDVIGDAGDDVLGDALNEMTMRGWESLPQINEQLPGGALEFAVISPLPDNQMFDAVHVCLVQFGDLGLYRLGPIRSGLTMKMPKKVLH